MKRPSPISGTGFPVRKWAGPERARILHILGYLLLYAGRTEEAMQNTRAAHDWALKQRLSDEAASFKAEMASSRLLPRRSSSGPPATSPAPTRNSKKPTGWPGRSGAPPTSSRSQVPGASIIVGSRDGQAKYLDLSLRALELADSLKYRDEASGAATKVGTYYALRSDYSRALSYFLKALNDLGMEREDKDLIGCLNNMAGMYIVPRGLRQGEGLPSGGRIAHSGAADGGLRNLSARQSRQSVRRPRKASSVRGLSAKGLGMLRLLSRLERGPGRRASPSGGARRDGGRLYGPRPPGRGPADPRPGPRGGQEIERRFPGDRNDPLPVGRGCRCGPARYPRPKGISRKRAPYPDRPEVRS